MERYQKYKTDYENFLAKYKEIKPSQEISQMNIKTEVQEMKKFD